MAKSYEQRLEEQRLRQKALRERKRHERSPHRDDIARMLLHVIVRETVKGGSYEKLDRAMDLVTRELVEQGFDKRRTEQVIEEIIERHERGWQPAISSIVPNRADCPNNFQRQEIIERNKEA